MYRTRPTGTLLAPPDRRTLHDALERRVKTETRRKKRQIPFLMCVAEHNDEGISLAHALKELRWSKETGEEILDMLRLAGLIKIRKGPSDKGRFLVRKIHLTNKGKEFLKESPGEESTLTQKTSV